MAFTDNFGNPKGILGRMMLVSMDKEHLPMAEWPFTQFEIPEQADIVDIGCGGGFNIQRMLSKCKTGKIYGFDISEESVKKAKKVNRDELEKRVRIFQGSVRMMGLSFLLFPMILNLSHIPVQNYLILMKDKPRG